MSACRHAMSMRRRLLPQRLSDAAQLPRHLFARSLLRHAVVVVGAPALIVLVTALLAPSASAPYLRWSQAVVRWLPVTTALAWVDLRAELSRDGGWLAAQSLGWHPAWCYGATLAPALGLWVLGSGLAAYDATLDPQQMGLVGQGVLVNLTWAQLGDVPGGGLERCRRVVAPWAALPLMRAAWWLTTWRRAPPFDRARGALAVLVVATLGHAVVSLLILGGLSVVVRLR